MLVIVFLPFSISHGGANHNLFGGYCRFLTVYVVWRYLFLFFVSELSLTNFVCFILCAFTQCIYGLRFYQYWLFPFSEWFVLNRSAYAIIKYDWTSHKFLPIFCVETGHRWTPLAIGPLFYKCWWRKLDSGRWDTNLFAVSLMVGLFESRGTASVNDFVSSSVIVVWKDTNPQVAPGSITKEIHVNIIRMSIIDWMYPIAR